MSYELFGRAAGTLFRNEGRRRMVVARDARLSSPRFQAALMEGLRATGMDMLDIGMVATPVMYFAVEVLGTDAGAIVSASHNPGIQRSETVPRRAALRFRAAAFEGDSSGTYLLRHAAYIQNILGSVRQPASDIGNDGVGSHQRGERRYTQATLRADGRAVHAAGSLLAPDEADG